MEVDEVRSLAAELAWIFREARRDTALELAKVPVLQGMMRLVESP